MPPVPVRIIQIIETTLLCLVNYASLMATNASRYRKITGPKATLLEFGLRRAQVRDSIT
jgi:nicotinate phosphoribosyltransferase